MAATAEYWENVVYQDTGCSAKKYHGEDHAAVEISGTGTIMKPCSANQVLVRLCFGHPGNVNASPPKGLQHKKLHDHQQYRQGDGRQHNLRCL
jgi:hypothetical protein